jgi:hypothetical protein
VWQCRRTPGPRLSAIQLFEEELLKKAVLFAAATALILVSALRTRAWQDTVRWKRNGAPTETYITGGGWTLEQSGAAVGLKSAGYCDSNKKQVVNPGTQRMQPYYFPFITGRGKHLQGYVDFRPKDIDEAVAAAFTDDAGLTWTFQQLVLELTKDCPTTVQSDPDKDADNSPDPNNSDNSGTNTNPGTGDDGQGHEFILKSLGTPTSTLLSARIIISTSTICTSMSSFRSLAFRSTARR